LERKEKSRPKVAFLQFVVAPAYDRGGGTLPDGGVLGFVDGLGSEGFVVEGTVVGGVFDGFVPFGDVPDGFVEPGVSFGDPGWGVVFGVVAAGLFGVPGVEAPGSELGFGVVSGGAVPGLGVVAPGVGLWLWPDGEVAPGLVVVVPPWPGALEPLPAVWATAHEPHASTADNIAILVLIFKNPPISDRCTIVQIATKERYRGSPVDLGRNRRIAKDR
jgi:hypothetical protein